MQLNDFNNIQKKLIESVEGSGSGFKDPDESGNPINESLKALAEHVKKQVPLCDSLFRYQSEAYFDTFKYAKQLREAGSLPELDWESEEMLGTDIGESVELKGVGRVWLDVPYLNEDESIEEAEEGMIGEPDDYYDAEERKEAYDDLQTALDGVRNDWEKQSVIDGVCPECSGSSYMDGDYDNDEDSCYGWGNYGCDQGEMENASWVEIIKFDQQNVDRQQAKDNYPGDEEVIKQAAKMMPNMDDPRMIVQQLRTDYPQLGRAKASDLAAKAKQIAFPNENIDEDSNKEEKEVMQMLKYLHNEYVKSGKNNVFDLPSILRQQMPELDKAKTREYFSKFLDSGLYEEDSSSAQADEAAVAKMIAKALGDENRWTEMSAHELYAELESENSELADVIQLTAKMLYDVRLKEGSGHPHLQMNLAKSPISHLKDCPLCSGGGMDADDMGIPTGRNIRGDAICPSCNGFAKIGVVDYAKELPAFQKKDTIEFLKQNFKQSFEPGNPRSVNDAMFEGQERSIIRDAMVDYITNHFRGNEHIYSTSDEIENSIASTFSVASLRDFGLDEKEDGGQLISDFTSNPSDVLSLNDVTEKVLAQLDVSHIKEAEYQGKKVELNKPKRGGSKKYYVYVKNPKTDRVKKISFGDVTGLRTKAGNKKRAKSFAARHNCEKKNDKMKAGYWACRLPRYGLVKGGKWW